MTKTQAIQNASYLLGENIREEFKEKEDRAITGGNTFFYVYNSEGINVRVDVVNGEYEVSKEPN